MKRFIIQSLFFVSLLAVFILALLAQADGASDPFYLRFTSNQKKNLILGTSRAAQGIQPEVLNGILKREFFNYSFTIADSPFGPSYYKSIKRKLDPITKKAIFILTIDPWSISSISKNANDTLSFRELNSCVEKTKNVNSFPNYEYLFDAFSGDFVKILQRKLRNQGETMTMFLHEDGWLEVTVPMDSLELKRRTLRKIKAYRATNLPIYKPSNLRLAYLKKTIKYLKQHGQVYLVRLPICSKMMEIENELMPDFDSKILFLSAELSAPYLDMTPFNSDFKYTDGNHLYKNSGKDVSKIIGDWINAKK
jgi:hypothetical protein